MPAQALDRHFTRRMVPVAALAALVVAAVPPLAYRVVAWQKLAARAEVYARHVAGELRALGERQPYLWRYNAGKILQATAIHRDQRDVGPVVVLDCAGRALLSADAGGPTTAHGPQGRSPVVVHGRTAAWVEIRMSTRDEQPRLWGIAGASTATGLLVGLLIFVLPTRVVRRQARTLGETLDRLRSAEAALTAANQGLSARVAAGVREVHELSARVIGTQEEERRRIARDLHDSVGQSLTALRLELELAAGHPEETAARLAQAVRRCEETLKETRRVVHDLRPPELATAALREILRSYTERFEERTGITASFRCPAALELPEVVATCLLRVLQEALTNVSRHSGATEVGVTVALDAETVTMTISDNGVGADATAAPAGAGLRGMRERCEFLGGDATVELRAGAGARVEVRLPRSPAGSVGGTT
jgi:signal transduction histidine kinase